MAIPFKEFCQVSVVVSLQKHEESIAHKLKQQDPHLQLFVENHGLSILCFWPLQIIRVVAKQGNLKEFNNEALPFCALRSLTRESPQSAPGPAIRIQALKAPVKSSTRLTSLYTKTL